MRNKILTSIACIFLAGWCHAQSIERSVVSTAGGEVKATGLSLEYTVGEAVVGYFAQPNLSLNQGFNQGYLKKSGSVEPLVRNRISIFPNPSTGLYSIQSDFSGQYEVYTLQGKIVAEGSLKANTANVLNGEGFMSGVYFLLLISDKGDKSTVRISKM